MSEVEGLLRFRRGDSLRVGKRVPAPVRHRREGNALFIVCRVALQSRHVHRGGEVAVAHGQRRQRVGSGDDRTVAKKNSLAIDRGCCIVGVVSKHFHFERSPDERPDALGVVVADGFAEVVVERAVAPLVLFDLRRGLQHLRTDTRAESGHGAAVGQRNGLVGIDTDEIVDDALVGFDTCVAIFLAEVALAVGFQQDVGEHGGAGGFEVVALASGRVHDLIPDTRLLVLPTDDSIEVLAQQFDDLTAAAVVLGQCVKQFDECHRVPALGASPAVL